MKIDLEYMFGMLLMITFVLFFIYSLVFIVIYSTTEQLCLENGWKEGIITWNFQRYCGREENEYEIVKPLKEIIKE